MSNSLRGVVFDAYGTLFDVYSIAKRADQLFPGMGGSISALWRDKQIEYSRLVSLSDPSPSGSRYYQSFWDLTRLALEYTLKRLSLPSGSGQVDDLMRGYATLDAFPECLEVLQSLKAAGLITAILSNGSPEMLKAATESAGLASLVGHLISVEETRHFKTSPLSYALAPSKLKLPKESLLFVSSNGWDVVGASWFGFRTCWINRQDLPVETIGAPPDYVCSDLRGVLEPFRA